jgi:hypothetical protein
LRLVISEKSGSFDGHIEAIYESATRLTASVGSNRFATPP